ncbi:MAG: LysR family transcriptional regulator [Planctomycetes bacterium]|nr:LysR family transcriptional regulator [Planctomycetota bacterium]
MAMTDLPGAPASHAFTLRQLQYIVAVAEDLSFRRAAERCLVSQPALSAQLAQVERALGVVLFERDRRRVLATTAGAAFVERARLVLRAADDLEAAAKSARDPFERTLRVGVIPTISPYLLPRVTPALAAAYPRLVVHWLENRTADLVHELEAGRLDAALVALEAPLGDVGHAVVATDPFVLATGPDHPLGRSRRRVAMAELAATDVLLLDDGHCFREQALAFCSRARARELGFRATSLSTLVQMVAAGGGVTLLPELALEVETARTKLRIRRFVEPAPARTIVLVWRRGGAHGDALRQIAATLRRARGTPFR